MKPLREKFILVTGSTDGIGKITALRLARMGAGVILHGRDPEKCHAVRDEIWKTSGNPKLEYVVADFSSISDVRHMAASVREGYEHLDVLINNAGILPVESESGRRHLSAQGYDLCLAVNYLAPFLLTHLLQPCLRNARAARIINIGSAAQEPIDFDNLMLSEGYTPLRAYAQSKLALTMFTFELHQRLKDEPITVNCLHPGSLLDTKMVRQAFAQPRGSAESGAEAEVYLATHPDLENVSGLYFDHLQPSQANPQAYDATARSLLWQRSLELTGLTNRPAE
jgi:NAD(P)-dependent dehydrogenase (short-subunit alcohol dehydrogenase family)